MSNTISKQNKSIANPGSLELANPAYIKDVCEILKGELRSRSADDQYNSLILLLEILIELYAAEHYNTWEGTSTRVVHREYSKRRRELGAKKISRGSIHEYVKRLKPYLERYGITIESLDRRRLPFIPESIKKKIRRNRGRNAKNYFFIVTDVLRLEEKQELFWTSLKKRTKSHVKKTLALLGYSDKLFVPRKDCSSLFLRFLKSNKKNIFLIIGSSGKGKTTLLSNLALNAPCPNLLIPGIFYTRSQISLREEVNSILAGLYDFHDLKGFDELSTVLKVAQLKKDVFLIFIDALENFRDRGAVWEGIVRLAVDCHETGLKFCVSCRSEAWRDLLREKRIFVPVDQVFMEEPTEDLPCSLELTDFDEAEFQQATERYKEVFQCRGDISKQDLLKDPFLMRLLFETFQGSELPEHPFRAEVLQAYWQRKIERGREEKSEFIEKLAEYLLTHKQTHISYDLLRNQPWFDREIFKELVEEGVLVQSHPRATESIVTFFHERLLEYAVAKVLYALWQDHPDRFAERVDHMREFYGVADYFLDVLEEGERLKAIDVLMSTEAGRSMVCKYINHLDQIDEIHLKLFEECVLHGFPAMAVDIARLIEKKPKEALPIVEKALKKDEDFPMVGIIAGALRRKWTESVDVRMKTREWFKSEVPSLRAVAVKPVISEKVKKNPVEALNLLYKLTLDESPLVREQVARLLSETATLLHKNFSQYSECARRLASDSEKGVRSQASWYLAEVISAKEDNRILELLTKWIDTDDANLKETAAAAIVYAYRPGQRELLELIQSASCRDDDLIKKVLVKALLSDRALHGRYLPPVFEEDPTAFRPLIESIIIQGNSEFRKDLAYSIDFTVLHFEHIQEVIRTWLRSDDWRLKHMGAMLAAYAGDIVTVKELQDMLSDSHVEIRACVPDCVYGKRDELSPKQIFSLLESLSTDSDYGVRLHTLANAISMLDRLSTKDLERLLDNVLSKGLYAVDKLRIGISMHMRILDEEIEMSNIIPLLKSDKYAELFVPLIMLSSRKIPQEIQYRLIRTLLFSPDWRIRAISIMFLSGSYEYNNLAGTNPAPVYPTLLSKVAKDPVPAVREALTELFFICTKDLFVVDELWPIIEELARDDDWFVRAYLANLLGTDRAFASEQVSRMIPILEQLSSDPDWFVRMCTALTLNRLALANTERLLDGFKKDKHEKVREYASLTDTAAPSWIDLVSLAIDKDLERSALSLEVYILTAAATSLSSISDIVDCVIAPLIQKQREKTKLLIAKWKEREEPFFRELYQVVKEKGLI